VSGKVCDRGQNSVGDAKKRLREKENPSSKHLPSKANKCTGKHKKTKFQSEGRMDLKGGVLTAAKLEKDTNGESSAKELWQCISESLIGRRRPEKSKSVFGRRAQRKGRLVACQKTRLSGTWQNGVKVRVKHLKEIGGKYGVDSTHNKEKKSGTKPRETWIRDGDECPD